LHPIMSPHEQFALSVNHSLHRLLLVYEMLEEIHESADARHPGDEDLKQGAYRAVTTMLDRLKKLQPPTSPDSGAAPSKEEEIAGEWLIGDQPQRLLPPDLYEELAALILRFFPRTARITGYRQGGYPSSAADTCWCLNRWLAPTRTTSK
jgi:hypothetical protein